MTDYSSDNPESGRRRDKNSSPLGRGWGWSETGKRRSSETGRRYGWSDASDDERSQAPLVSGSAGGDVSRNENDQDAGTLRRDQQSGRQTDMMRGYNNDPERGADTDMARVGDNIVVTGGR